MTSQPTTTAFVARVAPERLRGRYMGVLALAWNSAAILGPQFGFRLLAHDPRYVWFSCVALGLMAAAITLGFTGSGSVMENKTTGSAKRDTVGV
jgi:MFS family permease